MASYIDSLVTVLGGAGDRPVLRSAGTSTTGAELLAAVYLSAPPSPGTRARMIAQFDPRLVVVFPETIGQLPDQVTAPVAAVGLAGRGRGGWVAAAPAAHPA